MEYRKFVVDEYALTVPYLGTLGEENGF